MISLIQLLTEVSPGQAKKDDTAADTQTGRGSYLTSPPGAPANGLTPAQVEKRKQTGVPIDAVHAGYGRWTDKSGKTLGFTRDGKFVPAATDADAKASQRGHGGAGAQARTQQSRTQSASQDQKNASYATPQQKAKKVASAAVDKLQSRWGAQSVKNLASSKYTDMVNSGKPGKNPLQGASAEDGTVIGIPLADYEKQTGASRKELDAVGKYNSKYGATGAQGKGLPLGVHDGKDGSSWVILRSQDSAK